VSSSLCLSYMSVLLHNSTLLHCLSQAYSMVLSGSLSTIAIMPGLIRQHGTLVLRCQSMTYGGITTPIAWQSGVSVGSPRQRAPIVSVLAWCAVCGVPARIAWG